MQRTLQIIQKIRTKDILQTLPKHQDFNENSLDFFKL